MLEGASHPANLFGSEPVHTDLPRIVHEVLDRIRRAASFPISALAGWNLMWFGVADEVSARRTIVITSILERVQKTEIVSDFVNEHMTQVEGPAICPTFPEHPPIDDHPILRPPGQTFQ